MSEYTSDIPYFPPTNLKLQPSNWGSAYVGGVEYACDPPINPDFIVVPAFGADMTEISVNQQLVDGALNARELSSGQPEIYVQAGMEDLLDSEIKDLSVIGDEANGDASVKPDKTTEDFMRGVIEDLDEGDEDYEDALLVAQPYHYPRASFTLKHCGREYGLDVKPFVNPDWGWSEDDGESWVRDANTWEMREMFVRPGYAVKFLVEDTLSAFGLAGI